MNRAGRELIWLADELLDRLPAREDGRWYRRGDWGCRLGLHRWWWPEADELPRPGGTYDRGTDHPGR